MWKRMIIEDGWMREKKGRTAGALFLSFAQNVLDKETQFHISISSRHRIHISKDKDISLARTAGTSVIN